MQYKSPRLGAAVLFGLAAATLAIGFSQPASSGWVEVIPPKPGAVIDHRTPSNVVDHRSGRVIDHRNGDGRASLSKPLAGPRTAPSAGLPPAAKPQAVRPVNNPRPTAGLPKPGGPTAGTGNPTGPFVPPTDISNSGKPGEFGRCNRRNNFCGDGKNGATRHHHKS